MGKLAITGGEPLRKTPFTQWPLARKEEAVALDDVLTSSKWGGEPFPGKHASAFAKKFADVHTAKYAQCVNTGTVAIQASLKAVGIEPGDEVIAPAYTREGTDGPVLLLNDLRVYFMNTPAGRLTKIQSRRLRNLGNTTLSSFSNSKRASRFAWVCRAACLFWGVLPTARRCLPLSTFRARKDGSRGPQRSISANRDV
jgi:DegT/DnrJ/EryC1/StrS aminotransferase family